MGANDVVLRIEIAVPALRYIGQTHAHAPEHFDRTDFKKAGWNKGHDPKSPTQAAVSEMLKIAYKAQTRESAEAMPVFFAVATLFPAKFST